MTVLPVIFVELVNVLAASFSQRRTVNSSVSCVISLGRIIAANFDTNAIPADEHLQLQKHSKFDILSSVLTDLSNAVLAIGHIPDVRTARVQHEFPLGIRNSRAVSLCTRR